MRSKFYNSRPFLERLESRIQMSGEYGLVHTTTMSPNADIGPMATAGHFALFCNENDSVDIYNSITGQWSTTKLSQTRAIAAAIGVGNMAVFAGGSYYRRNGKLYKSNVIDIYNARTERWSVTELPVAEEYLTAASVGDKAVFTDGENVFIYDTDTRAWSTARLSQSRGNFAMAVVGSKLLFAGGLTNEGVFSNVVDIYDADMGQWSTATLSQGREFIGATTVGDLAIFAGGLTGSSNTNTVDIYNSNTDQWTTAALSQARSGITATTVGNLAIFAGGDDNLPNSDDDSNVVDIYNVATDQWGTAALSAGRSGISAAVVGADAIFAGGVLMSTGTSEAVDIYDANLKQWYSTGLSQGRYMISSTTVGSTAMFVGGSLGPASGTISNVVDSFTALSSNVRIGRPSHGKVTIILSNTGPTALPASAELTVFGSTNGSFNETAVQLGRIRLAAPLAAGASEQISVPILIPLATPAGQYHLIAALGPSHQRVQIASTRHTIALSPSIARLSAKDVIGVFNTGLPISQVPALITADNSTSGMDSMFTSADQGGVLTLE